MWKWIIGGVSALLLIVVGLGAYLSDKVYLRSGHATVAAAEFDRTFTPSELQADFLFLTATIERLHPRFDAIVERDAYEQKKASILASLDRSMTRETFYRAIAPIDGEFRDGHTGVRRPEEEWQVYKGSNAGVVPLLIELDDQGVIVKQSLAGSIPPGARLRSINGEDAASLMDQFVGWTSGETLAFRRSYVAERFAAIAWAAGLRSPYTIAWTSPDGAPGRATMDGTSLKSLDEARGTVGSTPFHLQIEDGVAHVVISSLDEPRNRFEVFLKSTFTRIRDEKVRTVVLDLRQNGGGDSRQGDLLQSYLSDDKLPALSQVTVRTSPEVKARYRTLLPEGFGWIPIHTLVPMLRGIQQGPDYGFYTFDPDGATPTPRLFKNGLAFHGELYVLVSPNTYSSAVIFAVPLKYWKRAVFVGEPAGEPLTFYGDNYEFDLPHTKLEASVSHKTFTLLGSKGPQSRLEPDITIAPGQDAYQIALQDIDRKRAARGR
jgi:Peptidase family S41